MIRVRCAKCKRELDEPGAILLSPPSTSDPRGDDVVKKHLCVGCYDLVAEFLRENPRYVPQSEAPSADKKGVER